MARIRSLKPDMWQDEQLGTVTIEAQALFVGLITQADDEGRLKGGAARMRALIWPYKTALDTARVEEWLDELQSSDLLVRYENADRQYLALSGWSKHQRIDKPTPSEIPAPDDADSRVLGNPREGSQTLALDRKGKDRKGIGSSLRSDPVEPSGSTPNGTGEAAVIRELFAYWQQRCGHPQAKLTADRRGKVKARLREGYTAEQIRAAIDGAAEAPFVGDNGKRYDDLELICRKGSKVEDFIERGKKGTAEKADGRWSR